MSKDTLVKISIKYDQSDECWDIIVTSKIKMRGCNWTFGGIGYASEDNAKQSAKRLLPLFVNAVLEE